MNMTLLKKKGSNGIVISKKWKMVRKFKGSNSKDEWIINFLKKYLQENWYDKL